jgi:hypothetical protein
MDAALDDHACKTGSREDLSVIILLRVCTNYAALLQGCLSEHDMAACVRVRLTFRQTDKVKQSVHASDRPSVCECTQVPVSLSH